jgi:hypothetical protein
VDGLGNPAPNPKSRTTTDRTRIILFMPPGLIGDGLRIGSASQPKSPPRLPRSAARPRGSPDAAATPIAEIGRRAPAGLGTRHRRCCVRCNKERPAMRVAGPTSRC